MEFLPKRLQGLSFGLILLSGLLSACSPGGNEAAQPQAQADTPPSGAAPAGDILRAGHLGRSIGDIGRTIHFYHDLLGAGLAGNRDPLPRFFASQPLTDFVTSPPEAEYRAINMPLPGTSVEPGTVPEMVVEVIEFRNFDRHQYQPGLQDAGVSNLKLIVRDLDRALATLKEAGVLILTEGGEPVAVTPTPGLSGSARAIIVRDPDGYPVELVQLTPAPASNAPADSNLLGAHISLVVNDLDTSLNFYSTLLGPDLRTWKADDFTMDAAYNQLRNTPNAEHRLATMLLPGTATIMELIQYRGIASTPYRPEVQDIGVGHVAFMV
ncbi:MAG TPA: VOC family protein, partial [Hyphomicrobiales bacterium]|nr:VOC family protein [Hyphomicrobiales bacterium]